MDTDDLFFPKCIAPNCGADALFYEPGMPSLRWCILHKGANDLRIETVDTRIKEVFDYRFCQPSNPKLIIRSVENKDMRTSSMWADCAYCGLANITQKEPLVKEYIFDAHNCTLKDGTPYYHRGYFCIDEVECRTRTQTEPDSIEYMQRVIHHRRKKFNEKYPVETLKDLFSNDVKLEMFKMQLRENLA